MANLKLSADEIRKMGSSGRIHEILAQIKGIDSEFAAELEKKVPSLLELPELAFNDISKLGGSVIEGVWVEMWNGLFALIEPLLPAFYSFLGDLSTIKELSQQQAFKELRPTPIDVGAALTFIHRNPEEKEEALESLRLQGYSEPRIRQLLIAGGEILNEEDIKLLLHRNKVSQEQAEKLLQNVGYDSSQATQKTSTWNSLLDVTSIRDLFLRGEIDNDVVKSKLGSIGFNAVDIESITKLFFFVPPAQDLITMSVREVFTPEISERFGQFEDFPQEFVVHAQKIGISREWAERYWAAHWDLPSIQMGFEMLHRDVIDDHDLTLLLKAKDVMPFWRDKLEAISYNPLTRVDVRRMHAMGVLDRAGVKRAYLDIGYNDKNAELMTSFTETYNSRRERDLSKSEVVKSYLGGLVSQENAIVMLFDMGYDEQETALILTLAEIKQADKIKRDKINVIKKKFVNDNISRNEANSRLQGLNLAANEIDIISDEFDLAKEDKAEELTLPDLKAAFKRRVIQETDFRKRLISRGYNDKDADILVKLIKGGG